MWKFSSLLWVTCCLIFSSEISIVMHALNFVFFYVDFCYEIWSFFTNLLLILWKFVSLDWLFHRTKSSKWKLQWKTPTCSVFFSSCSPNPLSSAGDGQLAWVRISLQHFLPWVSHLSACCAGRQGREVLKDRIFRSFCLSLLEASDLKLEHRGT